MARAGIIIIALLLFSSASTAFEDNWRFQVGLSKLDPDVDEDAPLELESFGYDALSLDDDSTMHIELVRDTGDIFAIAAYVSAAFQHEFDITGGDDIDGEPVPEQFGTVRQYTLMLNARWYPLGRREVRLQPFLQAGAFYMAFFDGTVSPKFERFLKDMGRVPEGESVDIDFHNEWNVLGGVGLDIFVTDRFFLALGANYLNARTKVRIKVSGSAVETIKFDYDPWLLWGSFGYTF